MVDLCYNAGRGFQRAALRAGDVINLCKYLKCADRSHDSNIDQGRVQLTNGDIAEFFPCGSAVYFRRFIIGAGNLHQTGQKDNGVKTNTMLKMKEILYAVNAGEKVSVTFERNGQSQTKDVVVTAGQ